jgi:hypothetical protein
VTTVIAPIPTVIAAVRALPGEHFLCHEVADVLEVSPATLRRLSGSESMTLGPTANFVAGGKTVAVYDLAAVDRLFAYLSQHRSAAGRPRLWSDSERRARRLAYNTAGYRRRRAASLHERGRHADADRFDQLARDAIRGLRDEHCRRSRELAECRSGVTTRRQ